MAIPGIPNNIYVQQANRQVYINWSASPGATSYLVNRGLDGVNFTQIANPTTASYLDTDVIVGTTYYYQISAASVIPVAAIGSLTFSGQPAVGNTVSIANVTFTAVASGATGNQFNIGANVAATIINLVNAVNTALTFVVIATASPTIATLTSYNNGPEGNAIELLSSLTNVTAAAFAGGTAGVQSPFSSIQSIVPTPTGEMSLGEIRLKAQQRSDLVNSNFLTLPEWNFNINQAMFELYDLLVTVYEDYFMAPGASFITSGNRQFYPLPDGVTTFLTTPVSNVTFVAPPFYKLLGVDLAINTAQNASVTLNKFNFIDRNKFIYPNTASTIYGVFNLEYRIMGNQLELIPAPSSNQPLTLWYIPRLNQLLQDSDITTIGFSGWLEYVIVRAAILGMVKQQLDSSQLEAQLLDLRKRIEDSAMNRDAGRPDHISDVRGNGFWNNGAGGFNGSFGGF